MADATQPHTIEASATSMVLGPVQAHEVLAWLGVAAGAPSLRRLNQLVAAYVRRVPWESASRIARWSHAAHPEEAARWPASFWRGAMESGTGGTCFESNAAFFALLRALAAHFGMDEATIGDALRAITR